jgi:hypothetical protein
LVDVTLPVVLTSDPAVVPLTLTLNVQAVLTGIVAPLIEMLVAAAAAVNVPVEQLLSAGVGAASTTIPVGNVSVTPTPVNATVFADGLVIVMVNVDIPLTATADGVNDLAIVGGPMTVKLTVLLAVPATGV